MNFKNKKTIIIACILILIMLLVLQNTPIFKTWQSANLYQLDSVRNLIDSMISKYQANPVNSIFYFIITYIIATALTIPLGNVLSICAGAVFGFKMGIIIALISTSTGATLSSMLARFLFRNWATKKVKSILKEKYEIIHHEIHQNAFFYIVGLRMTMFIPFAALNWTLGLTSISVRKIFLSTFVGQIPVAAIFVNAGRSVLSIHTISEIFTFRIALTITALAVIPFLLTRLKFENLKRSHDLGKENLK